jgi:hypothetical protein
MAVLFVRVLEFEEDIIVKPCCGLFSARLLVRVFLEDWDRPNPKVL